MELAVAGKTSWSSDKAGRLDILTICGYAFYDFIDEQIFSEDGAMLAVDYVKVHQHLPGKLKKLLKEEGSDVFTIDMLNTAFKDLNEFDSASKDIFMLFFEPPSIDQRIINQYALFSILSSSEANVDEWLEKYPGTLKKFVVPASLKWEIRDKLDQANITERVLFPGLDGLSKWLKRLYTTRT
jgi:hypothetical protein